MALVIAALLAYLPLPLLGAQKGAVDLQLSFLQVGVQQRVHPRRLLLQVGSQSRRGQARALAESKTQDPRSASWFDTYSAEESDYHPLDDPDEQRSLGERFTALSAEPVAEDSTKHVTESEAFFRETESEGPKEAVQTYPVLETEDSRYVQKPDWKVTKSRTLVQDRVSAEEPGSALPSAVKNPQWFERSSDEYDAYGRPKVSVVDTDGLGLQGLAQRSVSVNVTCRNPGCSANATMDIYNPKKEYVQRCKLNFAVHATDFDDNYAGERVFNILANDRALGGDCFPLANGCVSNLSREQLFPCVNDIPVDSIISSEGKLRVKASIPTVVDECPYNSNLLHGVSTVTCWVGNITESTTITTTVVPPVYPLENDFVKKWLADHPNSSIEDMPGYKSLADDINGVHPKKGVNSKYGAADDDNDDDADSHSKNGRQGAEQGAIAARMPAWPKFETRPISLNASAFMRCAEKGCGTGMLLDMNRTALRINKCVAQVYVNQTDFDNSDGAVELLNITVGSKPVLVNAKPGQNPCRDLYDGKNLTSDDKRYHALKDYDITEAVKKGPVGFHASISHQVDECASNGYLLDSMLEISCSISTIGALLQDHLTTVKEVLSLNEIVYNENSTTANDAMKDFFNRTEMREAAKANSSSSSSSSSSKTVHWTVRTNSTNSTKSAGQASDNEK
eukprot:TRINITY_DN2663_c2_g1_i1.p1 TRINITY_DN2663_c2_g1~~TRINITY_DN2663_c2_g1_i1.p1  ORF type:complete len:679 (-),score=116.61 TRINITY_DN2663_c2_g1_i1:133-2169(-)